MWNVLGRKVLNSAQMTSTASCHTCVQAACSLSWYSHIWCWRNTRLRFMTAFSWARWRCLIFSAIFLSAVNGTSNVPGFPPEKKKKEKTRGSWAPAAPRLSLWEQSAGGRMENQWEGAGAQQGGGGRGSGGDGSRKEPDLGSWGEAPWEKLLCSEGRTKGKGRRWKRRSCRVGRNSVFQTQTRRGNRLASAKKHAAFALAGTINILSFFFFPPLFFWHFIYFGQKHLDMKM